MTGSKSSRRISPETILHEAQSRVKDLLCHLPPETPEHNRAQDAAEQLEAHQKRGEQLDFVAKEAFADVSFRFNNPPIGSFIPYYVPAQITPLLRMVEIREHDYAATACIKLLNRDVHINTAFAEELADVAGAPLENIMRGILEHELGHYFFHPEHLALALYLSFQAEKGWEKKDAGIIYPLYTDFIANIAVVDHDLGHNLLTVMRAHAAYCLSKAEERRQNACRIIEKAQEIVRENKYQKTLHNDRGVLGRTRTLHRKFSSLRPEEALDNLQPGPFTRYALPDPVDILRFLATKKFLPQLKLPFGMGENDRIVDQFGKPLFKNDLGLEEVVRAGIDSLNPENFSVLASPREYGLQLGLLTIFYNAYKPLLNEMKK